MRRSELASARMRARRDLACSSSHLLAPRAIRYCVRFRTLLYSRKLIVIRAGSTETRVHERETRTPRVLRGFSPHRVADDEIITGRCERIACGGPLRLRT